MQVQHGLPGVFTGIDNRAKAFFQVALSGQVLWPPAATGRASVASSSVASCSEAICFRGQISRCVGACGPISSNAKMSGSSYTIFAGICFAAILQKRQSALIEVVSRTGKLSSRRMTMGTTPSRDAKFFAELFRRFFSGNFSDMYAIESAVPHAVTFDEDGRIGRCQPGP